MKKVLLLGDSIRMGYLEYVKNNLENKAEIYSPDENCRFAKYTFWEIGGWLGKCGKPDVVHWNNGIWDVYKLYDPTLFTPVNEYVRDMMKIYAMLKKTGAKIIFATTTAVGDNCQVVSNTDVDFYNQKMLDALKGEDVDINDLNGIIRENKERYVNDTDCLHLTDCGYERLGKAVAESVEKWL